MILISLNSWISLTKVFGGGPKLEIFIINNLPDFNPIEVFVCQDDPSETEIWNIFQVSEKITVQELKEIICDRLEIEENKITIRIIDELQFGTTAFRSLSENVTLKNAGIRSGSKISVSKQKKRVVRFVDSDEEEQDKVVEISVKHYNSTGMRNLDRSFYIMPF